MAGIGTTGLIIIVFVALLLFGPSKLPELGRAFGRTLKEFKNGTKELTSAPDNELIYESNETKQVEKV